VVESGELLARRTELARRSARHALISYLGAGGRRGGRVWCFTDAGRRWLAEAFAHEAAGLGLRPFVMMLPGSRYCSADMALVGDMLRMLTADDMVISASRASGSTASRWVKSA
jgi:hypothetical protein